MKTSFNIISFILIPFLYLNAQTDFNTEQYKQFLQSHQNMTTTQLLEMHDAGSFKGNINSNYNNALYFDSISIKYNLTNYEKELIAKHGFMVSERLSKLSFGESFLEIYQNDLPVFVSSDAILHAFHVSYDRILKDVELGLLIERVGDILNNLSSAMPQLHDKYSSNPEMEQMLKDVDVYLTVPRKLFNETATPFYSDNSSYVDEIINEITNEQGYKTFTLFSENCRVMDWSQFKPRGHYVDNYRPELAEYFRVMMWLGRIEIYLLSPRSYPYDCPPPSFKDIQRQTIDALLVDELFNLAGVRPLYEEVEDILQFFVGKSDNVTLPDLQYLKNAVGIVNTSELLDSLKLVEFQDTLKNQSFAYQLILSQILTSDPFKPDSIIPASSFLLFGQRFVIDSYVTGSVVYDRILYNNQKICRLFPSALDVLFSLGNDAAAQLLQTELDQFHYSSNLSALRYLIDNYDNEFWQSTLYNSWLGNIRSLNPPAEKNNLPDFMQTAAFWQQKMNTQLSSWTQLRHDNLLYAKQSYTGGTLCVYPYTYIEPFPELYLNLKAIADIGLNKFQSVTFSNLYYNERIIEYFEILKNVSDTLASVAQKELDGIEFTSEEKDFLKRVVYNRTAGSGQSPYDGWYANLFYNDKFYYDPDFGGSNPGLMGSDYLVADIHTTPTDCDGIVTGWIPHVGTGPVNLGVWVTELPDGQLTAFIGPVLSYYEYVTDDFERLTDSEWEETYLYFSMRPDWVNIYLADSSGISRGPGNKLITSVSENPDNQNLLSSHLIAKNYPNPFNPYVIINFSIPYDLTNSPVELIIYDIQGQKVKTLINDVLPSGNYLTKWNATTDNGSAVSSGIYLYILRVAGQQVSGKMIYQK
jgi:hypothetical protein